MKILLQHKGYRKKTGEEKGDEKIILDAKKRSMT
jgi:hypothetical protein